MLGRAALREHRRGGRLAPGVAVDQLLLASTAVQDLPRAQYPMPILE